MIKIPIKNYTTKVPANRTINEIEQILAKYGATHIYKSFDGEGFPTALAFKTMVGDKQIAFKLPMEENKLMMIFKNSVNKRELPSSYLNNKEQARRTGWRIIKDWIDSQMALIDIHLAKFEEIFLPYMYSEKEDMTLFEIMEKREFNLKIEDKR